MIRKLLCWFIEGMSKMAGMLAFIYMVGFVLDLLNYLLER